MQFGTALQSDLLIEFLTEELPPINLERIFGETFSDILKEEIKSFITTDSKIEYFVTPRRFGVIFTSVNSGEMEQRVRKKGPAINTGIVNGEPTKALLGFMRSVQIEHWQDLEMSKDGYFYSMQNNLGRKLVEVLPGAIQTALKKLPIAKNMRWGNNDFAFVRPLHNLLILYGEKLICENSQILNLTPVNYTYGHRVMSNGKIFITNPGTYFTQMRDEGKVVANFLLRRQLIKDELYAKAKNLKLTVIPNSMNELLDEVTAIVEYPVILEGEFDPDFLLTPQECLILSMAKNQKYFALLDENEELSNKFLFVANIASTDPGVVIKGNEKVLAARLSDAKFFYDSDKKRDLSYFVAKLDTVVYHNKLGSQALRVKRLHNIANKIAPMLNVTKSDVTTAVSWLKADLMTEMVGEFPELQGIMGKYYALNKGVEPRVAEAIEKHYYPRFSRDKLPDTPLATVVALADKLETLVGIWGLGLVPTGEKDPFALRRNALGIIRILLENDLDILQLLEITFEEFTSIANVNRESVILGEKKFFVVVKEVYTFIVERLLNYLITDKCFATNIVKSVLEAPNYILSANKRYSFANLLDLLPALTEFALIPKNQELFQANKRIENILKKNATELVHHKPLAELGAILIEPEEKALFNFTSNFQLDELKKEDWPEYFLQLEKCSSILADFFANIMVMVEDPNLRSARLTLLVVLKNKFNYLCNMSELAS